MEVEKRKRFEDHEEADGKRAKVETKADQHTTTTALQGGDGDADGEVEEFYAILRRIHVAVKYFENEKATGKKKNNNSTVTAKAKATSTAAVMATATSASWNLNFKREDFEGGCDGGVKEEEKSASDSASLDLNVEPDPDSD